MTFEISSVRSDESVMFRNIDGTFRTTLLVSFIMGEDPNLTFQFGFEGQIRETGSGVWRSAMLVGPATTEMRFWDVEVGVEYDIRFRFLYTNGTIGEWVSSWTDYDDAGNPIQVHTSHVVQGNTQLPPDLATFTVTQKPGSESLDLAWTFTWRPVDLVGVELRYGSVQDWDTMTFLDISYGDSVTTSKIAPGTWEFAARPINWAVNPTDANKQIGNYAANPSYQNLVVEPPGYMTWKGLWVDGQYLKNEVVRDGEWLMIANKTTEERAGPQPIGETYWLSELVGTPTWAETSVNSNILLVGQRYSLTDSGYARMVRMWIPDTVAGFTAELWMVRDPLGAPEYVNLRPGFIIDPSETDAWLNIAIGETVLYPGAVFDLVAMFVPATGDVSFIYEWDYKRQNGDPPSGEIWHQSGNNADQMRVHQEDQDSIDRSTELDQIGPGSTISMATSGFIWDVLEASKTGSVYTFAVDPASRAGAETSNFTFTYYAPLPIDYVYHTDFYISTPGVEGLFSSVSYENITVNNNAYGVDIEIQDALVSADWDLLSTL